MASNTKVKPPGRRSDANREPVRRAIPAREFAGLLSISTRQLFNLRRAGMPAQQAGNGRDWLYDAKSVGWYLAHKMGAGVESAPQRRARIDADIAQLNLDKLREELVPRDVFEGELRSVLAQVRTLLETHPVTAPIADELLALLHASPPELQ